MKDSDSSSTNADDNRETSSFILPLKHNCSRQDDKSKRYFSCVENTQTDETEEGEKDYGFKRHCNTFSNNDDGKCCTYNSKKRKYLNQEESQYGNNNTEILTTEINSNDENITKKLRFCDNSRECCVFSTTNDKMCCFKEHEGGDIASIKQKGTPRCKEEEKMCLFDRNKGCKEDACNCFLNNETRVMQKLRNTIFLIKLFFYNCTFSICRSKS